MKTPIPPNFNLPPGCTIDDINKAAGSISSEDNETEENDSETETETDETEESPYSMDDSGEPRESFWPRHPRTN